MELKPCPFCGGEIRIVRLRGSYGEPWYARCDRCEVSGYYYKTEAQAIEAWSDRPERTCRRMPADDGTVVVRRGGFEMEFPYFECSACGAYVMDNASYCPICGARVVGEVDADGQG